MRLFPCENHFACRINTQYSLIFGNKFLRLIQVGLQFGLDLKINNTLEPEVLEIFLDFYNDENSTTCAAGPT